MSYIDIIPIGEVEEALLLFLKQSIFQTFKIQTRIRNRRFNLSPVYDPVRNQYNSSGLLLELINDTPPETLRILGVTELDLFIPIFTFLFGELLRSRLLKEGIHELGHTFGLIHCFALNCVMKSSTYVEDIDQKPTHFCKLCEQAVLKWQNGKKI